MAKVISFTKSLNQTPEHALEGFVDDGDLLEFPHPKDAQTPERAHQARPESAFAPYWTNQELADLYRAYSLIQSAQPGLECDRGVSDEDDPWFLIGDDKGDVLIHICRIKGIYILDSVALSKPLRGPNFNALIEDFLTSAIGEHTQGAEDDEPLNDPTNVVRLARGGTVCLHPSMMIAALVWTLLMNADALTLPPSNGSIHRGLDQGQDGEQDTVPSDAPVTTDFQVDDVRSKEPDTSVADFSDDLVTKEIAAQKDDKQLPISAYSHALTTIAIAAGFYTSSEAADVFWKSFMEAPAGSSTSLDEVETNEASSDPVTFVDHLSDALTLLGSVVDHVVLESREDYAGESNLAGGEGSDTLNLPALGIGETMEASIGQQMLTKVSDLSKILAEASQAERSDSAGQKLFEAGNIGPTDMAVSLYGDSFAPNITEQTSGASIRGITQDYASQNVDVSRYDSSSFQSGLGKFNGKLQKYSEVFEESSFLTEEESPSDSGEPTKGSSYFKEFDAAARKFIDAKIANSDLEILVFDREIIFVDKAAFSGNNTSVSWQLEDGGLVSMIGLSSDMAEFLVA